MGELKQRELKQLSTREISTNTKSSTKNGSRDESGKRGRPKGIKTERKPERKLKRKPNSRIKLDSIPKYTDIKQMVEATLRRMLLEPVQSTQSPDIIVFQNGVLNLKCMDMGVAFSEDSEAAIKHSHAVWSYFDKEVWLAGSHLGLLDMAEKQPGQHFRDLEVFVGDRCPVFAGFMRDWFPGDSAAFEAILRWFGYCMTTDTGQAKFMFFYGPTRAGKGSLARLLCGIVGANNYAATNYSAFEDKFQAIGMHDKLVVTMEEVEATPKEHERRLGMLKKYLGGERVVWENKYMRAFEDEFIGKIIMQSNEVLAYEDKGRSVTARMVPVEFRESFYNSGEEAPERDIFRAGEGDAISTIAAMMWYRMTRNRIKGAFDFKKEPWSLQHCRACRHGEGSLLLESHKIAWKFLHYKTEKEMEDDEFRKLIKKKKLVICTRNRLKDLTELLLEYIGKKAVVNLPHILKEAVRRDWPESKEICFKISELGRCRGWKGLYIDVAQLKREYPEVFDNAHGMDEKVKSVCG